MREGAGLLRGIGHLVENDAAGFVDGDPTTDQILGEAPFQTEASCQIVDSADPLALGRLRIGDKGLRVGMRIGGTDDGLWRNGRRSRRYNSVVHGNPRLLGGWLNVVVSVLVGSIIPVHNARHQGLD